MGSFVRGFYSITGARVARILLHVLLTPLIVRALGPQYGDYAFLISVYALVMVVPAGGAFVGARKFMVERRGGTWEADVFGFYTLVTVGFVLFVAGAAAVALLTGVVDQFGAQYQTYTILLVFMVMANAFMNLLRSGLVASRKETISESLFTVQMLLMGLVGLPLVVVGYQVVGLLVGHLVATVAVVVAMFVFLSREFSMRQALHPNFSSLPAETLVSFSILSVVLELLRESLIHVDLLFIRVWIGVEATAQYKASLLSAEFLWVIPIAVQQVLLYSTSELWAKEDHESIQNLSARVTRYSLLLTALLSIGIAVLAEEFVTVYFGPGFEDAVLPLLILLPGAFGFAIARGIYSIGQGKGEMRILIMTTGAAALINLVLNVLLIPRYGTIGAAIATSVGYGSMFVFHTVGALYIGFNPLGDVRLAPLLVTSVTTALVLVAVDYVVASDILTLLVVPPVGLVLFAFLSVKTGALDVEEIHQVTGGVFAGGSR